MFTTCCTVGKPLGPLVPRAEQQKTATPPSTSAGQLSCSFQNPSSRKETQKETQQTKVRFDGAAMVFIFQ
jgi:hypothetical protein